jgi:hypothetical protein
MRHEVFIFISCFFGFFLGPQNQLVIWTSITQKYILWRLGGHQDRCDSTGTWRPVSEVLYLSGTGLPRSYSPLANCWYASQSLSVSATLQPNQRFGTLDPVRICSVTTTIFR